MSKLEEFRSVVRDEGLPAQDRTTAAEMLIQQIAEMAEKQPVQDDDPEVIKLMKPWKNAELAKMFKVQTPSLSEAKVEVSDRRRLLGVLAVVVDETAHRLERLAACAWVLEKHPQISKWSMNQYTPERMLADVIPADGVKWTANSMRNGPEPVLRPPMNLQDVWAL